MPRIAVIVGHARKDTYGEALGAAYRRGAEAAGASVSIWITSKLAFDPVLHEGFERIQPLEPDLAVAREALLSADHLVIIFPLWLGTLPAILKGFLERVLQPDLVGPSKEGKFVQLLKGKSARVVVTMGMPAFVYRWWFGAHAVKMLKHNILGFMGVKPVAISIFGSIEAIGQKGREKHLAQMEAWGRALK
jgi:NAD(P)H dehydrogenase (quinone)